MIARLIAYILFAVFFFFSGQIIACDGITLNPQECHVFPKGGQIMGYNNVGTVPPVIIPKNAKICAIDAGVIDGKEHVRYTKNGKVWPTESWAIHLLSSCLEEN